MMVIGRSERRQRWRVTFYLTWLRTLSILKPDALPLRRTFLSSLNEKERQSCMILQFCSSPEYSNRMCFIQFSFFSLIICFYLFTSPEVLQSAFNLLSTLEIPGFCIPHPNLLSSSEGPVQGSFYKISINIGQTENSNRFACLAL